MITYELVLLLRVMPKNELTSALRRISDGIFQKGGVIRKIENLGTRNMPYKTSVHGVAYRQASYYLMEFNAPPQSLEDVNEEYGRDVDIIRKRIYKVNPIEKQECTIQEELQPPPYRKDVQDLIAEARKLDKPKFQYNSGLDYYPFQK